MDEFDWRGRDLTTLLDSTAQLLVWALNVKFCQMVQYAGDRRSLILRAGAGWRNEAAASRDTRIEAWVGSFAGFTRSPTARQPSRHSPKNTAFDRHRYSPITTWSVVRES